MEKRTTGASLLRLADAFSTPFEQAGFGKQLLLQLPLRRPIVSRVSAVRSAKVSSERREGGLRVRKEKRFSRLVMFFFPPSLVSFLHPFFARGQKKTKKRKAIFFHLQNVACRPRGSPPGRCPRRGRRRGQHEREQQ